MTDRNIAFIPRPGKSAIEERLSAKYLALMTRIYRYRRAGNFTLSCAAGKAADVVLARIANLETQRIAA